MTTRPPCSKRKGKTPSAADVVAWRSNWKSRGEGRDPISHETGDGLRKPSRDPNPEDPLDFN